MQIHVHMCSISSLTFLWFQTQRLSLCFWPIQILCVGPRGVIPSLHVLQCFSAAAVLSDSVCFTKRCTNSTAGSRGASDSDKSPHLRPASICCANQTRHLKRSNSATVAALSQRRSRTFCFDEFPHNNNRSEIQGPSQSCPIF